MNQKERDIQANCAFSNMLKTMAMLPGLAGTLV